MGPPHDRALDPYAPPRAREGVNGGSAGVDAADTELPPGVRRYRLNAVGYARLLRLAAIRSFVVMALTYLIVISLFEWNGMMDEPLVAVPNLVVVPLVFLGVYGYVRRMRRALFAAFEILVSERVIRRVAPHVGAAEALRPEVTSIFETNTGLTLVSREAKSALFVSRALDGYEQIRGLVAEWAPIEPAGGLAGWWRAARASSRQRVRDARDTRRGTVLERDPSLAAELDLVRSASNEAWKNYSNVRVWIRILWFLVALSILVLLAGQALLLLGR
jgi:hypothetical protein